MKKIYLIIFFVLLQSNLLASNKDSIINKLEKIDNITFNFINSTNGKDEKGKCILQYPKKIFCEYEKRNGKILVSNGTSIVIKKGQQYFRYSILTTPFEYILDKNFLINRIQFSNLEEIEDKYYFFEINENNNNINIFFSKENYDLVGWQVEDIYQNLAVTYIFNTSINKDIDDKLFKLPAND